MVKDAGVNNIETSIGVQDIIGRYDFSQLLSEIMWLCRNFSVQTSYSLIVPNSYMQNWYTIKNILEFIVSPRYSLKY